MLFATVAAIASLAGLALAGPAGTDHAKWGDYGGRERAVHRVTVGECSCWVKPTRLAGGLRLTLRGPATRAGKDNLFRYPFVFAKEGDPPASRQAIHQ